MGWTTTWIYRFDDKGNPDRKDLLDGMFDTKRCCVLKSAMVGAVYYAAVEKFEDNSVIAFISPTRIDDGGISYKLNDESYGYGYYDCPKSILDLLTPTEDNYANEWRKNCYENIERKNRRKQLGKLAIGTVIRVVVNGNEYNLVKRMRNHQFKTDWWQVEGKKKYFRKNRIPDDYQIVKS